MSDNRPQHTSQEFADFVNSYNFSHVTNSPHFPQSSGHVNQSVQTMKGVKTAATLLSMLCYRTISLSWWNITPAELFMGQCYGQLSLEPKVDRKTSRGSARGNNSKQKENFDCHHHAQPLAPLLVGSEVCIRMESETIPGRVIISADSQDHIW